MKKHIGPKALDPFAAAKFALGEEIPFSEAFPTVRKFAVEVTENGTLEAGYYPPNGKDSYSEGTISEYISCHNPLCYGGGFRVLDIIRDMIKKGETVRETNLICFGHEGSARQAHSGIAPLCTNSFAVDMKVEYESAQEHELHCGGAVGHL